MTKKAEVKKIDKTESVDLNNPICSAFTSPKTSNPACKACEKAFNVRFIECHNLAKSAKKAVVKKIAGSSLDCFGFQISSDTHRFVNEIAQKAMTMKAIKQCLWNSRPNTFYCAFGKLQKEGFAKKDKKSGSLILTASGLKKLNSWIQSQKTEKTETQVKAA